MKHTALFVIFLLATFGLFPDVGRAGTLQSCNGRPDLKELRIYYVNGVGNSKEEARLSLATLVAFVRDRVVKPANTCTSFRLAENPTAGYYVDILESANQRWELSPEQFWLALVDLGSALSLSESQREEFASYVADSLAQRIYDNYANDQATILKHVALYKDDYKNCRSILLVAHSQGNLYARQAFEQSALGSDGIPLGAMHVVDVATPDIVTVNGGPYATSSTDRVINVIRSLINALPANTSWAPNAPGLLGHSFDGYLGSLPSGNLISEEIETSLLSVARTGCFRFSQPTYSADVSAGVAHITVLRTGGGDPVTMTTSDGTAIAGIDYNSVSTSVISPSTELQQVVDITLLTPPSNETGKTLVLKLLDPTSGEILSAATLTISLSSCLDQYPNPINGGTTQTTESDLSVNSLTAGGGIEIDAFPVSATFDGGNASASANGQKGNMTVSSHADYMTPLPGRSAGTSSAVVRFAFVETILITAPGKTGWGSLAFNPNVTASSVLETCNTNLGNGFTNATLAINGTSARGIGASCSSNAWRTDTNHLPIMINFTYGVPLKIKLDMYTDSAVAGYGPDAVDLSSTLGLSYNASSFQIENQAPDTKIQFCRSKP